MYKATRTIKQIYPTTTLWNRLINHKPAISLRSFASTSSSMMPPPQPVNTTNRTINNNSNDDANSFANKRLNRVYYLSLAIFSFLLLDYLQSSVAAGAALYSAEEMRQLHKQISNGTNNTNVNTNNDALRADILALMEGNNRHYEAMSKEIADLRAQLNGNPITKPHEHRHWRDSVETLLSDVDTPKRQ